MRKLVETWQPTFIQSFTLSQLSDTLCRNTDWEVPFPGHFGDALQRLHGKLTASLCSEFVQTSLWPCGFLQEAPKATLGKQQDPGHLLRRRGDNSKGKVLFYCSFKRARNRPDNDPLEMYILEPFREQELTLLASFPRVPSRVVGDKLTFWCCSLIHSP